MLKGIKKEWKRDRCYESTLKKCKAPRLHRLAAVQILKGMCQFDQECTVSQSMRGKLLGCA